MKQTILCKGCGKPFVPCKTRSEDIGAFNWRTVACSIECAQRYFKKVEQARNQSTQTDAKDTLEDE